MERDDLDDFIDELANYVDQRRDPNAFVSTVENTKDRTRIALIRFLDGRKTEKE